MAKKALKDRTIKALKAAKPGQRYDVMDAVTPGAGCPSHRQGQAHLRAGGTLPREPQPHPTRAWTVRRDRSRQSPGEGRAMARADRGGERPRGRGGAPAAG